MTRGIHPGLNGVQIDALAAYIATLRPGEYSWTKTKIEDQLLIAARDHSSDPITLSLAAQYAALGGAKTPKAIPMPGDHWRDANHARSPLPQGVIERKDPHCANCGGIHGTDPCMPRNRAPFDADAARDHLARIKADRRGAAPTATELHTDVPLPEPTEESTDD